MDFVPDNRVNIKTSLKEIKLLDPAFSYKEYKDHEDYFTDEARKNVRNNKWIGNPEKFRKQNKKYKDEHPDDPELSPPELYTYYIEHVKSRNQRCDAGSSRTKKVDATVIASTSSTNTLISLSPAVIATPIPVNKNKTSQLKTDDSRPINFPQQSQIKLLVDNLVLSVENQSLKSQSVAVTKTFNKSVDEFKSEIQSAEESKECLAQRICEAQEAFNLIMNERNEEDRQKDDELNKLRLRLKLVEQESQLKINELTAQRDSARESAFVGSRSFDEEKLIQNHYQQINVNYYNQFIVIQVIIFITIDQQLVSVCSLFRNLTKAMTRKFTN